MSTGPRATVRWTIGLVAAGALVFMSYRSLEAGFSLAPHVVLGMLALIVLLVYGAKPLEDLIDSWRGGGRNG